MGKWKKFDGPKLSRAQARDRGARDRLFEAGCFDAPAAAAPMNGDMSEHTPEHLVAVSTHESPPENVESQHANRLRPPRMAFAVQHAFAHLRECGVEGDDDELATLLECARYDVDRAVNIYLDGLQNQGDKAIGQQSVSGLIELEPAIMPCHEDADIPDDFCVAPSQSTRSSSGPMLSFVQSSSSVKAMPRSERKNSLMKSSDTNSPCNSKSSKTYASMSRKSSHRGRAVVTLLGCEGQALPTGVHYEVGPGESYDVDVVAMQQTHVETGTIRNIRREKPGTWRFAKRDKAWGKPYPPEVASELERIFLMRGNGKTSWSREANDIGSDPVIAPAVAETVGLPEFQLGVVPPVEVLASLPLDCVIALERSLPNNSFPEDTLYTLCETVFASAERGLSTDVSHAAILLAALVSRQGLQCDVSHVRRAALIVGSMRLLQVALSSSNQMQLVGLDLFDRKYQSLKVNDTGRKNCIRCLLARGMRLGRSECSGHSKLLRKLEADAESLWAARWLDSMMLAEPSLPESLRGRVLMWLG